MRTYTYGDVRKKIELDLDLQNETNVTPDEMVGYCNEAVDEAFAEILKTNEAYFEKTAQITLVAGTTTYSLPSDIYANKIRNVTYDNHAGIIYPVRRIRGDAEHKFTDLALTNYFATAYDYRYIIQNTSSSVGYQIVFIPAPRESGSFITVWYVREANHVPLVTGGSQAASDAVVIDIPEFMNFIIQYMKVKCLKKDGADPRLQEEQAELEHQREMMVSTLTQMVQDDDDTILPDMEHYYSHE